MDLGISGLASGFDWKTLVEQLVQVERTPQTRLRSEQSTLNQQNTAYTSIKSALGLLQDKVKALKEASLFNSRLASISDATMASATAGTGTPQGTYLFNVTQLATSARQVGASGVGASLSPTNDVSGLALNAAAFSTTITAGNITVNGRQVSIETTDTLQNVFDKINATTGGAVTGSYDVATDKISLTSAGPVVLGSATDTSNFLQVARLNNNGTGTVTSANALGAINTSASLGSANLTTAIDDGGAGAGEFKINGVSINFATTDSISAVLQRINDSGAGVSATYDAVNDRFILANKTTGDMGIALEDVSGNFLAASGLSGGALARGNDLIYTINNGPELVSHSNTVTEGSSSIPGLSLTVLKEGQVSTTVSADTSKMKTAINDFLEQYNKVQSLIDTQTASSTDADGKVTAGTLASDGFADELGAKMRRMVTDQVAGLGSALNQLEDIGIIANGKSNSLSLVDEDKLDEALTNSLSTVTGLFTDSTNGLGTKLATFLDQYIGEEGSLIDKQDLLTKTVSNIDTQIADMERIVQFSRERLTASFLAMEEAQAKANQQLSFLEQRFGSTSSS